MTPRSRKEQFIIVHVTVPTKKLAHDLGRSLVDEHLAACANLLGRSSSIYRWKGKVEEANEFVLLLKTVRSRFPSLKKRILQLHPYETPCIVSMSIEDGHDEYLKWIRESVR